MDFEQVVIRFAYYVFALIIVTTIAIYLGVFVSGQEIAIALIIGWVVSAWQSL